MKSNLFKRLASLPGINWFNRKEKVEYEPGKLTESLDKMRTSSPTWHDLKRQNERYFKHMFAQDQYISVMNGLIDMFGAEVDKWDDIQLKHEAELQSLKDIIRKRDIEIKDLQKTKVKKVVSSVVISDQSVDKLIAHLERNANWPGTYTRDKVVKRAREMHNTLHNFLQKLKANTENGDQ